MTPKFKTRNAERSTHINFLKKSEECFRAARDSYSKGDWNAAAICSVHRGISACDALCVYFLGKRHSGDRHGDAVALLLTIDRDDDRLISNAARLGRILGIKNMAEYEERLVYRSEAEKALKDCERFLAFTKSKLPDLRVE